MDMKIANKIKELRELK